LAAGPERHAAEALTDVLAEIDRPLGAQVREARVGCLALAAYADAGPVFAKVYRADAPDRADHAAPLFAIGSQSKSLAVCALLTLVERQAIPLDTPFHRFLPELALPRTSPLRRVTLLHLTRHQSPIARAEGSLLKRPDGSHKPVLPRLGRDALLQRVAARAIDRPSPWIAAFQYSDFGIALVGLIVERLAGDAYDRAVARTVLKPAGIVDLATTPAALAPASSARLLSGHDDREIVRPLVLRPRDLGALNPAQGCVATALAASRFYHLLLTGRLLPARTTRLLHDAAIPFGDPAAGHRYAPGIIHLPVGDIASGARCLGHLGIAGGFCGFTAHFPPLGATLCLQMNTVTDRSEPRRPQPRLANPAGFVRKLLGRAAARLGLGAAAGDFETISLWRATDGR
jgi:CubicO group peptidase (beta-lactamase class C family)